VRSRLLSGAAGAAGAVVILGLAVLLSEVAGTRLAGLWSLLGGAAAQVSAALPIAFAGTPWFLQLAVTVMAGVLAREGLSRIPATARFTEPLRRLLNRVVLWVTLPALVFHTVHGAPLGAEIFQGLGAAVAGMAGTAVVAWVYLTRIHGRTAATGGLVLAASVGSVSFLGIPIVAAAFGTHEARIAVYFAVLNVPLALLAGAVISARTGCSGGSISPAGTGPHVQGDGGSVSPERALHGYWLPQAAWQFLALPATWALVAALALHDVALPPHAAWAIQSAARTVAPVVMFALGMGLRFERSLTPYRLVLPAAAIKLAVSPIVVFLSAKLIGLSGLPLAVVVLQGAMPTQVLGVVIAERYRLDARLVGLTLAMDTVVAFATLPLLVGILHAVLGT
jgi:predicted permease